MLSSSFGGGFAPASNLPYRTEMAEHVPRIKGAALNYIKTSASNNAIFNNAVKTLTQIADGDRRLNDAIVGVINYVDYLANGAKVEANVALEKAIEQVIDGFVAGLVLNGPTSPGLDYNSRATLERAVQGLITAADLVNRFVVPEIEKQRRGGSGLISTTGGLTLGGGQIRRSDAPSPFMQGGGSQGGLNLMPGNVSSGGIFNSPSAPSSPGQGGGLSIDFELAAQPTPVAPVANPINFQTQAVVQHTNNYLVTYMNYEQHKTHGLLKSTLPSDSKRRLMPATTIDQSFAAMNAVSNYRKLDDNVVHGDLVSARNTSFALKPIAVTYGARDYSSAINADAGELLKLGRADLDRLTFSGELIQFLPETDTDKKISNLITEYSGGMLTHGRLTSMMAELEKIVSPETMLTLSRKVSDLATTYWRFAMGTESGEFDNYYEGHEEATEYLRREPDKALEQEAWNSFPTLVISKLFRFAPVAEVDPVNDVAMFSVGYIRIPYYGVELPFGVGDNKDAEYGVILKNATPGIYHLCQTLYEAYPDTLHRVLITNDGRLIEVIRPLIGDQNRFYIRELEALI